MDITIYETANRLKEAGFPQPDFATGQLWYNASGALSFIGKKEPGDDGKTYFFCTSVDTARTERMIPIKDGAFYAPTATDILRELGPGHCVGLYNVSPHTFASAEIKWLCVFPNQREYSGINPAEAAARAWLSINEKSK